MRKDIQVLIKDIQLNKPNLRLWRHVEMTYEQKSIRQSSIQLDDVSKQQLRLEWINESLNEWTEVINIP